MAHFQYAASSTWLILSIHSEVQNVVFANNMSYYLHRSGNSDVYFVIHAYETVSCVL